MPRPRSGDGRTAAQVIRSLAPSIYAPSFLEFAGMAALMPMVPLIALDLGAVLAAVQLDDQTVVHFY